MLLVLKQSYPKMGSGQRALRLITRVDCSIWVWKSQDKEINTSSFLCKRTISRGSSTLILDLAVLSREELGQGYRSLISSLTAWSASKTLEDAELTNVSENGERQRIAKSAKSEFPWSGLPAILALLFIFFLSKHCKNREEWGCVTDWSWICIHRGLGD